MALTFYDLLFTGNILLIIPAGADPGFFLSDASSVGLSKKCRRRRHPSAEHASFLGGSGGMAPRKILKFRTSEMRFPAFWEH